MRRQAGAPYIPAMRRHIELEGIANFRDYGGYATACGRGLKRGLLFRSGNHHRATDADLEALAGLGIAVIVDLRRTAEREGEPSRRWDGFSATVIDNDLPDQDKPWEEMLKGADPTPEFFRSTSREWYRRAPFEPRLIDLYSRYFAALCEADGAVLVHCAAGKDRTGIIVALTHHLAGVHRDDLVEDYLLTNHAPSRVTHAPNVAKLIARHTGRTPSDEAVQVAMGVQAEDLETALEVMEASHGSIDGYLERALGFDRTRRAAFEERFLGA